MNSETAQAIGTGRGVELPAGVEFVAVQWVDVHGAAKAKLIPREAWRSTLEPGAGAGFAGFANHGFARGPEHPEMLAVPDPETLTVLPHRPATAVAFSAVHDGDVIASGDSRSILARVQAEAAARGLLPVVGIEPEFFLLAEDEDGTLRPFDRLDSLDKPCYDLKALLRSGGVLSAIAAAMQALGWEVSALDHEDGNGQFEINFTHADALRTADRFTLLRTIVADIAESHGAIATFMPKPLSGSTGSGAHLHISAEADGANVFVDADDPRGLGLSKIAYSFIGGVLAHGRALSALTMPTVNSYRRLYGGGGSSGATWSPTAIVYGGNNRTAMLRVPGPGRFEDRAIDSSCNPYLAIAGIVAAGLDGVERGLDPGAPLDGAATPVGVETLPATLTAALDALELDSVLRDAIGEEAIGELIAVKRLEWAAYMDSVSAWEQQTYLRRT
jgi:glutamine synthetase